MSNGEVYFIYSMATLDIYNVYQQKSRTEIVIYS